VSIQTVLYPFNGTGFWYPKAISRSLLIHSVTKN
jgi:hypothetical protein